MKRLILTIILFLAIFAFPLGAIASDLTDANFEGNIVIYNSSTANTCVSVSLSANSTALIDAGYVDSDFDNVAILNNTGTDARFMPGYDDDEWIIWVPSIGGSTSLYFPLYIGDDSLDSTKYYFPGAGGMTVSDNTTIEPGDNFTITNKIFIDTSSVNSNIFCKSEAIKASITGTDNATAGILTTDYPDPSGFTDASANWTNETYIYDDNLATKAQENIGASSWGDFIILSIDEDDVVGMRYYADDHSGYITKIDVDFYYDDAWNDLYEGSFADETWETKKLTTEERISETRIRFYNNYAGTTAAYLNEIDFITDEYDLSATIPDLSSDEYELTVRADGLFFGIGIDVDTADFPISDNLTFNAPLFHADLNGATFTTKDANGYECTVSGANWTSSGYLFDGANDYISFDGYSANNTWTVEGWFYITDTDACSFIGDATVTYGYLGWQDATPKIIYEPSSVDGKGIQFTASCGSILNEWHHIAFVMEAPTLYCYVDDVLIGQGEPADGICDLNITRIGQGYTGVADSNYEGTMGEIRIYSDAIDTTENYNSTAWKYNGSSEHFHYQYSAGASINDNDNDWIFFSGDAVPYMEYAEIEVDGVQKGYWEWEYDTTFTDGSGNGNTATPTFRTTSSDADITATLSSFEVIDPAIAPPSTVQDAPDFYTYEESITDNFTSGNVTTGGPPGFALIEDIAEDSDTPNIWMWGILSMTVLAITGVGLSYARKRVGIGGGYVLLCIGIGVAIFGLMITFGKFDWWMFWFYIIIAFGIGIASRHIDWGGATSQHSIIGFLAMSWVGLTIINRILEGSFITAEETAFLNTVSFTQAFSVLNLFTIPILNFSFFTEGIPSLLRWDYSFFGGQAQIIQYMLYSITAVVSFIIFILILGLIYNYFSRLR